MRRRSRKTTVLSLSAAAAFYRTALVVAEVTGVPLADIVARGGPGRMRRPHVRFARRAAVYLTVTAGNVHQMRLATALGRNRFWLQRLVQRAELDRDRREIDELFNRMETML